jgi:hypothetical protein
MTIPRPYINDEPSSGEARTAGSLSASQSSWYVLVLIAVTMLAGCGDDDVSVEFTGDDCVYSGPTEFDVGDEFEITVIDVTEERMGPGYAVTKVPDGTSVDDALEEGFIERLPEDGPGTFLWSEVTEEGAERVMSITLDVAGTWLVHCFGIQNPETGGEVFPATTFEVVAES